MADRICLGCPERRIDFLADRTSQNVQPRDSGGIPSIASTRRHSVASGSSCAVWMGAAAAIGSATELLLLYYLLPIEHRPHQSVALRLGVGLTFFVTGLAVEIRAISKSGQPMLRAVPAMATVIPLFLVVFAWLYLTMSHSGPATFEGPLTRTNCLYSR